MRIAGWGVLCVLVCACCRVGCAVLVEVRMLQGGMCCACCNVRVAGWDVLCVLQCACCRVQCVVRVAGWGVL